MIRKGADVFRRAEIFLDSFPGNGRYRCWYVLQRLFAFLRGDDNLIQYDSALRMCHASVESGHCYRRPGNRTQQFA